MKNFLTFLEHLEGEEEELLSFSLEAFFADILCSLELFDLDTQGEEMDFEEIKNLLGDLPFQVLYACALDFFFSNYYRVRGKNWNIIDVFLKRKSALLPPGEKSYLKALRDSYMSLYEVLEVQREGKLILSNQLERELPLKAQEPLGLYTLLPGDILGARVLRLENGFHLAKGLLILSPGAAQEAYDSIQFITQIMTQKDWTELFLELDAPDIEKTIKKMWVKEIAGVWMEDSLRKKGFS